MTALRRSKNVQQVRGSRPVERERTLATLERAVSFLVGVRSPDGPWRDFDLEPGVSDVWVTAYVGLALLAAAPIAGIPETTAAVGEAASWCRAQMRADGSWGYNGLVPSDSDSTAHAVLLLDALEEGVPTACLEWLLRLQRPDGGIATFARTDPTHSWGLSHPDVTPVVLQALKVWLPVSSSAFQRGLTYVRSNQQADGLWRSFWWSSPLYGTLMSVRLLESTVTPYERGKALNRAARTAPVGAFEGALRGELLAWLGADSSTISRAAASLSATQLDDGSWPTVPMLRVTDPGSAKPWELTQAGSLAADQNQIFTTATVVRALALMTSTDS